MTEWETKGVLKRNIMPWWTRPNTKKRPPGTDPWKKVLPPGAAEATVVQRHVSEVIKQLALTASTPLRMVDAYKKVSFYSRKPDIVICPAKYASSESHPAAFNIIAVGDVKGRHSGSEFADDEIGKIISFLIDLLRTRPDRNTATGFLTDSYIIQFIRVTILRSVARVDYTCDVTQSYILHRAGTNTEPCGGDWLHTLLSQDPAVLGCPTMELVVDGSIVEIKSYLGEGSSSVVWLGRHKECDVVVKIFRTGHESDLKAEIGNLNTVKNIKGVIKCIGSDHKSILLLSPVGTPFSSHGQGETLLPSAEHFCQLLSILCSAHNLGLLHRDLSLSNFFLGADGKVQTAGSKVCMCCLCTYLRPLSVSK